jgi:ATP/maltotriose-dependent transcriptional regulator MalT
MKITLRKASALQTAIQEAVKNIDVTVKVELNEFENAETALATANAKLIKNDQRRTALTKVLYVIRAQVGTANAECGINERLAKAAYVDKRIGQLTALVGSEAVQDSMVVINGKIEKLKTDKSETSRRSLYGYSDTVGTGVLAQAQVDAFKAEQLTLKKDKQKLNDEVLELNVRTEIVVSDEAVAVLTQEGLI